jgi:hypothetical protein
MVTMSNTGTWIHSAEAAASSAVGLPKVQLKVEKYQLPNGLTVLLHQDHAIPMVSYHTWYKVGSRDESKGVTGAAHMLEHMMFKELRNTRVRTSIIFCTVMGLRTMLLRVGTTRVFIKTFPVINSSS